MNKIEISKISEMVQRAIDIEIESILLFRKELDSRIYDAVQMIAESPGKLVVTGVGKSGDIGKKIASTLSSTGTKSVFMHPTDASHGDLGILEKNDIILAIGKSGESDELLSLIPAIRHIVAKIIALTANESSRLAKQSDLVILTPVLKEACPLDLAPTSSTTIALIAGDAIAMALMEIREFKEDDFAKYHPAGRLGKRLSLSVEDVMRKDVAMATILPDSKFPTIIDEITSKRLGAVCVVDPINTLLGIITDFDIRKALKSGKPIQDKLASEIMNPNPMAFSNGERAYDILLAMENRPSPISVAPIVAEKKLVGMVLLHDLLQIGL